jgi:hypothetical protein
MTNPTSNFGWQMPEPTDLVTNLPADFEVFGQAVDSDFADLLGGTTGQVLSKTSNTDLDFTWIANDQGDITGVTAGTGISGGGTSGTVTVTNSMATAIDAKGDLVVGTGADAFSRLAVGTNTYVLTADSAEATGLKWAAPSGGSTFVGAAIYRQVTAQSISSGSWTTVTWDTENYDTDSFWTVSPNPTRITIPSGKSGKYSFNFSAAFGNNSTGARLCKLQKNGSDILLGQWTSATNGHDSNINGSGVLNLTAADYIEMQVFQDSGGARDLYGVGSVGTYIMATYLGA